MNKYGYRFSLPNLDLLKPAKIHAAARDYEELDCLILSHLMGK
jgi:hypothetical protein